MSSGAARPLTPQQRRAADMLGRGVMAKEVAREVGVASKTIQRWRHERPDFQELVRQARLRVLDGAPEPTETLKAALTATKRTGEPDWQVRVTAARALLGASLPGGTPEEQVRETLVFIGEDE